MAPEAPETEATKKEARAFVPGTLVNAKIGKDVRGPLYLVQIDGDTATIQGKRTATVPVADLMPAGD